jgi:hypothetical protein
MARSSVAAAMSFWLARTGVFGSSTLKSVLMRSRAYLPSSRVRLPRAEASPALVARRSHTCRYSSASLASSSRAWDSCALMPVPLTGEAGGALGPGFWGASPSPAPAPFVSSACSSVMTTKHSRVGS